jgi:hypothetical protein
MRPVVGSFLGLALAAAPAAGSAQFVEHLVATDIRFGYQVLITDLNRDDRPDIVGLGAQMTELLWFENPEWQPHVITTEAERMIFGDAADIDGDGIPEIALAYGFSTRPSMSSGEIGILRHRGDPSEPWTLTEIDAFPASHRIRWGDIDGSGSPVLINAPLMTTDLPNGSDPDRLPIPLVYYDPENWERQTITDENAGATHGLLVWDTDGDGRDEVLSAGRLGIHAHRLEADGSWSRRELSPGVPEPYPAGGSSDVRSGTLNNNRPFFAAIEPYHGNEVAVYRQDGDEVWQRTVIETELANGHSLVVADLSGNGTSEIVAAGNRGESNVYLYRAVDPAGNEWQRTVIDDSIAANHCEAADINGDGRIDIVCISSRQPNDLKWYENTGRW